MASGKRSAVFVELLREGLEARRRAELWREIIEGCREMAGTCREIEEEYNALNEEVHRALDSSSPPQADRAGEVDKRRLTGTSGIVGEETMRRIEVVLKIATGLTPTE